MVDPVVVRFGGELVDDLLGEAGADRHAVRPQAGQEPVVVAAALAEPPAIPRERQTRHDGHVELGRVQVAGHHA